MISTNLLSLIKTYQVNEYYVTDILWNVFLIIVPVVIYFLIKRWWYFNRGGVGNKILIASLFVLWFLFLPNTAYVMTDVRHLVDYCPVTEYDVCAQNAWMPIFFFAYSLIGWISFSWLLNAIYSLISFKLNRVIAFIFVLVAIPLSALGVLLGLLDRMNSWDVVSRPMKVYYTMLSYFVDKDLLQTLLVYSLVFFFLHGLGVLFLNKKSN